MTEDEFISHYIPEQGAGGFYYRAREWASPDEWALVLMMWRRNRLWTMVEGDDGWCLLAGRHRVNRLFYVFCEVAFVDEEEHRLTVELPYDD
jgi:hypothetical protein